MFCPTAIRCGRASTRLDSAGSGSCLGISALSPNASAAPAPASSATRSHRDASTRASADSVTGSLAELDALRAAGRAALVGHPDRRVGERLLARVGVDPRERLGAKRDLGVRISLARERGQALRAAGDDLLEIEPGQQLVDHAEP